MNELHKIPILVIRFANVISQAELPYFRAAVISKVPPELTLFHNHYDEGFRYHYPLIQYKRIQGKAAIVCLGEGTEAIGNFFAAADFHLHIGHREEDFSIDSMRADQWLLQTWGDTFHYTIRKWLPFNSANYAAYQQLSGIVEKTQLLEHILTGNMLSLCTGLGVHLDCELTCKVTNLLADQPYHFKGIIMQGFDLEFDTNLSLHDYVALGKGVSHGFGVVKQMNNK